MWRLWFLGLLGSTVFIALMMLLSGPTVSLVAWIVFLLGAVTIILQPRYGIYLVLFLTLVGDARMIPWFPFAKNFSSGESLLFLHNAAIFSPLEAYLVLILISWLGRMAMQRKIKLYLGPLFLPTLVFSSFIAYGLVYGILRGGNLNVALWESRAIFYLPLMMVLTANLIVNRKQFSNLMWFVIFALFIEAIVGCIYYFFILNLDLSIADQIAAHSAAIQFNTFFIYLVCVWIFRASWMKRLLLPLMVPFFLVTYIMMQRRAGFMSLAVAIVLIIIFLYQENRKVFFTIVPLIGLAALVYLAVFWNSYGALGMPAQAVKSVIAPAQASNQDRLSDLYRMGENYNALFNMRRSPLLGSGFGHKIISIVKLPDISHFVFWEYIIHNSIAWIWIRIGAFGFFSMLFFIGASIIVGMQALMRVQDPDLRAVLFTAIAYVVMHFTYAYVDMSWDIESMVYLGAMVGVIGCIEHVVDKPVPLKEKRWPWQPIPEPVPGLLPLAESE
ncbi:MAG: O-antigen ligase family protein [Anaerolineae bacterium]|nr:O-antigen ligase family protein [Anaerolineae bacterium]